MKVTPIEIRQKTFEKTWRGYNQDEVQAFLLTLSREWEHIQDELKRLHAKITVAEREIAKMREVEESLYKTLKTAEKTGKNVVEQAHKEVELRMREAKMKSESILNEAQRKAKSIIGASETAAKQILDDMEEQLKESIQHYKNVEIAKKDTMNDLERLANEMLQKVEDAQKATNTFDTTQYMTLAKRKYREIIAPEPTPEKEKNENTANPSPNGESFFDKI